MITTVFVGQCIKIQEYLIGNSKNVYTFFLYRAVVILGPKGSTYRLVVC